MTIERSGGIYIDRFPDGRVHVSDDDRIVKFSADMLPALGLDPSDDDALIAAFKTEAHR
jgi:hypothetical protein